MTDLTSFYKTDFIDDHTAADMNNLIAASLRSEYKNVETLSADRELLDEDTPIQRFECGAADRVVIAPEADSVNNHPYWIVNASAAARGLTIKDNAEAVTIAVLVQGEARLIIPDGAGGYLSAGVYKTPGAAGNVQTSDGMDWTSAPPPAGRNIIINGGFTVNQRGYVSAATLASGAYGHDRWKAGSGGGDYSFTQLASPTTITIAASKTLIQVVEDKNVFGGSYVLSWTGTALARYAVNSATPSGAYAASPILITGQTPGTVMSVEFGNGASSCTLGNVQLETGEVATPFDFRNYVEELAMCQRYFYKIGGIAGEESYGAHLAHNSTSFFGVFIPFPCTMRASPTVYVQNASNYYLHRTSGAIACTAIVDNGCSPVMASLQVTVAGGLTSDLPYKLLVDNASSSLQFSAEL